MATNINFMSLFWLGRDWNSQPSARDAYALPTGPLRLVTGTYRVWLQRFRYLGWHVVNGAFALVGGEVLVGMTRGRADVHHPITAGLVSTVQEVWGAITLKQLGNEKVQNVIRLKQGEQQQYGQHGSWQGGCTSSSYSRSRLYSPGSVKGRHS